MEQTKVVYTPEGWEALEQQRQRMFEEHIKQLIGSAGELVQSLKKIEQTIVSVVGDAAAACEKIVLVLAEKAGMNGVALSELRRYIPDPNHLNRAREALLERKDKNGKVIPAQIEEKRGENNELRLLLVTPPTQATP